MAVNWKAYVPVIVEKEIIMSDVKKQIKKIINEVMCYTVNIDQIDTEANLLSELYLDSLSYIKIIVAIEKYFNIEIKSSDLSFENFETYGEFEKMLMTYLDV
jgi:acyl carrier protein